MGWKEFEAEFLVFSRRERTGVLVLILLILLLLILPGYFSVRAIKPGPETDSSWMGALQKLELEESRPAQPSDTRGEKREQRYSSYEPVNRTERHEKAELFYFDPNSLSPDGWKKLGLRERTIQTIQNYLSKGGRFRKPADVQRIYGLFPDEYERIAPYIQIDEAALAPASDKPRFTESKPGNPAGARYRIIDINTADTTDWISLPGIGSKLSARILNFREKLGGFYSIEQVAEVYGLPDSTFQKIKPWLKLESAGIRKLNINTATLEEMKAHPYIRYRLAASILAYRKEHGPFQTTASLRNSMAVPDTLYLKLQYYLVTE